MKVKMKSVLAALCAVVAMGISAAVSVETLTGRVSTFEDVKFWTGSGTNKTVVVVDFNDGSVDSCAFAWGYRWDGAAPTVEKVLNDLAVADPRLTVTISQSQYGGFLQQIAYDHDNNPDTPDLEGAIKDYFDMDEDLFYYAGNSWMLLAGAGETYPRDDVAETPNGMSLTALEDGQWICWRVCTYASTYVNPTFEYVDYYVDTTSYYDPVAAEPPPRPAAQSFGDVQAWLGSGDNETVIVIDFNDGSVGNCSFAWGYRWNGTAPTVEQVMNELAAADPRLTVTISQSQYGGFLQQIAYDHDNNPYTDDLVGAVEEYFDMDDDCYYYSGTSWMLLAGDGATYPRDTVVETPNGMSLTSVADGQWICWRICTYASTYVNPTFEYVDYYVDTTSWYDPVAAWTFPAPLVAPTIESISVSSDTVTIVPGNVVDGCYYGLATASSPTGEFAAPTSWVCAENGAVILTAPKSGDSAFFKVVVTTTPAQ